MACSVASICLQSRDVERDGAADDSRVVQWRAVAARRLGRAVRRDFLGAPHPRKGRGECTHNVCHSVCGACMCRISSIL